MKVVKAALDAGADIIVLCDTNGGSMPYEIAGIVKKISSYLPMEKRVFTRTMIAGYAMWPTRWLPCAKV